MPILNSGVSAPRRTLRSPIGVPVDLTVTPTGGVAGQIQSGEFLYLTSNGKAASLATPGALGTLTTSAAIAAAGYQHVNTTQNPITAGLKVGMTVTIAGANENVLVQQVDATGFSANFTGTHSSGVAVTCTVANTGSCIGVSLGVYPNTYAAGITGGIPPLDANVPWAQVYEDGDHLCPTTAADSYAPYDVVYLSGVDGRTITKVPNGAPVGYVSPDQRQSSTTIPQPINTPIAGGAGVSIYIRITPALAK